MFQLYPCIGSRKSPLDLGLPIVPVVFPCGDMASQCFKIGNPPIQALSIQRAQFDLRHVEPTTMLGCVMDLKAFCQAPSLFRFKRLVKGGNTVCVQVVQDQAYLDSIWVAFVEHALDPPRPVLSRSMLSGLYVAFAGQRFHFKKDLDNSVADVFMVHPCRSSWRARDRVVHFPD